MTRTTLELLARTSLGHSIDELSDDADVHHFSVAFKDLT
jgi:hypothetical protein